MSNPPLQREANKRRLDNGTASNLIRKAKKVGLGGTAIQIATGKFPEVVSIFNPIGNSSRIFR